MIEAADPQGYIAAFDGVEDRLCKQLVKLDLAKHQHGLVYKLTDEGRTLKRRMR